ncbi:hypothetical protein [Sphingomonas sp. SRS2]|nr:hypothetical protein [Sphingomonas sp. SRS2]
MKFDFFCQRVSGHNSSLGRRLMMIEALAVETIAPMALKPAVLA